MRTIERFVADHEGDLTQAGRDVQRIFDILGQRGTKITSLEVTVGQHKVLLEELGADVKEIKLDVRDIRTSFRTVAMAVGAAAIAFAGLAVTIATQVPH